MTPLSGEEILLDWGLVSCGKSFVRWNAPPELCLEDSEFLASEGFEKPSEFLFKLFWLRSPPESKVNDDSSSLVEEELENDELQCEEDEEVGQELESDASSFFSIESPFFQKMISLLAAGSFDNDCMMLKTLK